MAPQVEVLEERLKSFLCQLQAESRILDRIIYKNKNQHRRCSYFQYLLKVRRDLKLLHSIRIEELLDSCFNVIIGRKAKQKAHLLESLKKSKCDTGKFNFMERLLGAVRLLSEMVEPMLKAAVEISTLLARSFFMGFSLMILALLARLRVLVQQMLLDVVSVFNDVSSIAQKKQSMKITQDGIEVFREYYPAMEKVITLECIWKTDKFMLVESINKLQDVNFEGGQTPTGTSVQYRSVKAFLGGGLKPFCFRSHERLLQHDELNSKEVDADNNGEESVSNVKRKRLESPATLFNKTDDAEQVQIPSKPGNDSGNVMPWSENTPYNSLVSSSTSSTSSELKPISVSNKRVAFISVMKPCLNPSVTNAAFQADESESKSQDDKETPVFNFFNGEDIKGSLF